MKAKLFSLLAYILVRITPIILLLIISSCSSGERNDEIVYEYFPFSISIHCVNENGENILEVPDYKEINAKWRNHIYKINEFNDFNTRAVYPRFIGLYTTEDGYIRFGMLQGDYDYKNETIILNWGNKYKQDTISFTRYPTDERKIFEKYLLNGKEVKMKNCIDITLTTP